MKYSLFKSALLGLLLSAGIAACSVSKEGRTMKKTIDGNWILETITTEGITGIAKTNVFNEAEMSCFIGSEWNFVANNSTGSYTIVDNKKGCPAVKRFIRWTVYEPKDSAKEFQFKRLDEKKNAMDNGAGYRLTFTALDKNMMKLKTAITFNGNPAALIYNFVKK